MDSIIALDRWLFEIVNVQMSTPFLDMFFHPLSNKWVIRFLVVFFMFMFFSLGNVRLRWVLVLCGASLVVTDVSVSIMKEVFARARPCNAMEDIIILAKCSESFSFPSRHTADIFSMAVILSALYARYALWFMAIAVYVGFSRIYLGMHYPFDVMAGIFVGSSVGIAFLWVDAKYYISIGQKHGFLSREV